MSNGDAGPNHNAASNGTAADDPRPDPHLEPLPSNFTPARVIGTVVAIGLVIFWVYVFANRGSITHDDTLADTEWTANAEALCAPFQQAVADLPNPTTVTSAEERAVLVAAGTVELEAMVNALDRLGLPDDPLGVEVVPAWLADWQVYLQNRRDWTAILETGDDPPFLISGNDQGVRVTDMLSVFAEVNNMESCGPSPDAG